MRSEPSEHARQLWQRMRRAARSNLAGGMPASATPVAGALCAAGQSAAAIAPEDAHFFSQHDAGVVARHDDAYPPLLAEIRDAPPLLFTRGDAALLSRPQVAIVGSRHASAAGLANARRFAAELAAAGFVITSGMALGIDAMAHEGTLAAGGSTVAVLGCGADVVYPRRHAALAERIRARGCLASECLPGTPPLAALFPQRNRIISALSLGVLVVEATPDSGSLITARFAAEQGREVFAIPGSIHAPTSQGCHQLIREGATLVERSADLVEALMHYAAPVGQRALPLAPPPPLPAEEAALLALMSPAGSRVEELIAASGLPAGLASALLSSLALRGRAAALPGGLWQPVPAD